MFPLRDSFEAKIHFSAVFCVYPTDEGLVVHPGIVFAL